MVEVEQSSMFQFAEACWTMNPVAGIESIFLNSQTDGAPMSFQSNPKIRDKVKCKRTTSLKELDDDIWTDFHLTVFPFDHFGATHHPSDLANDSVAAATAAAARWR